MGLSTRDVMTTDVRTVGPETTLVELNRLLIEKAMGGFPVVENDRLIGIVSRSDVVRHLGVEQSVAEMISDYYRDVSVESEPPRSLESISSHMGHRLEELRVRDVMIQKLLTAAPDDSLSELARIFIGHRIHRLPVVEAGRLVGIVTTLDLARLFAEGRVGSE